MNVYEIIGAPAVGKSYLLSHLYNHVNVRGKTLIGFDADKELARTLIRKKNKYNKLLLRLLVEFPTIDSMIVKKLIHNEISSYDDLNSQLVIDREEFNELLDILIKIVAEKRYFDKFSYVKMLNLIMTKVNKYCLLNHLEHQSAVVEDLIFQYLADLNPTDNNLTAFIESLTVIPMNYSVIYVTNSPEIVLRQILNRNNRKDKYQRLNVV